jgi:hypothetical protein
MFHLSAILGAVLLALPGAAEAAVHAPEPGPETRVGDVYEIRWQSDWSQNSSGGSSGESHSRNMLVERVIAVHDAGVEVELDLPEETPAEDRAGAWQYPARILRPADGELQLLNRAELEQRVDRWLQAAEWPREVCGRWIFTWNAFRIECDPQMVLDTLAHLDRWPADLREGAEYQEEGVLGAAVLRRDAAGSDSIVFVARAEADPEAVRRQRAAADAVTLEIMGESSELHSEIEARSAERISGTIDFTFETESDGRVRRRVKVTELQIEGTDGERETQTVTETVERRLVRRAEP